MRRSFLIGVMAASVVTVVLVRPDNPDKLPTLTDAEIVAKFPKEIQVLLPGGLCDNIHSAFLMEVERFQVTPTASRPAVQERIEYYREWLRRKGCG